MKQNNTKRAGGARKNRSYDNEFYIEKGEYLLAYYTDDSHDLESWNAKPPYDDVKL